VPAQKDPARKPHAARKPASSRSRRAPEDVERALLKNSAASAERLRAGLANVSAQTGQDVVSHLGHEVGNTAMHRVLSHVAAVAQADVPISITFGSGVNATRFDERMRRALEAILRRAGLHEARVIGIGGKHGLCTFDVAPGSVADDAAFVSAAEAEVGRHVDAFLRPPRSAAYHFEIAK